MKREELIKESKEWVEERIISEDQREQLLERYPARQHKPLLLTFAAIFIGLGFLTFIASNWSAISDIFRMAIIIGSLLAFYVAGEQTYRKHSKRLGESLMLIALMIFGAGIFLTGQMYHFTSFSALPFFVWSIAAFSLFLLCKETPFFIAAAILTTVGQVYSGVTYSEFHLWTGLLFILGLGWFTARGQRTDYSVWFGAGYLIQSLVFVLSSGYPYYWLINLILFLYLFDDAAAGKGKLRVLKTFSVISVFLILVFQVFFLGEGFVEVQTESSFYFFIVWAVFFVGAVVRSAMSSTNYYWIDLLLFLPVFRFDFADGLSLGILFVYSLLWLTSGYQQSVARWVNKGTAALLATTFIAYFQLAWDFMNRSLFFFIGGILLFALSFFLERKRRQVSKGEVTP